MTAVAMLELKQTAVQWSERERRDFSAYLIRLGQERPAWRQTTARRLDEMAAGKQVSSTQLRKLLGHADAD